MPILSLIAAMDQNRLIGCNNQLPWRLPADLKRFKALTLGKPVVMGRKTYDSIGRPLPDRQNIIITRNPDFAAPGCTVVNSFDAALSAVGEVAEIMVIGGMQIYLQALPVAQRLYLTIIEHCFTGNAWFPEYSLSDWQVTATEIHHHTQPATAKHAAISFQYRFLTLER